MTNIIITYYKNKIPNITFFITNNRYFCILFIIKVKDHVQKKFAELGSPNKLNVYSGHGAKAWVSDFNHPHYMAGRKAMKTGTNTE